MKKYKLIAGVCCVALSASLLSGCALLENPEVKEITDKVVDTVKNSEVLTELSREIYTEVMEGLHGAENIEIKEIKTEDGYVKLEITAPNLETILDDVFRDYEEELALIKGEKEIKEFLEEKVNEILESENFDTVTNEVEVEKSIDENGDVTLTENEEYINAIKGGISDLYEEYQKWSAEKENN